MNDQLNTMKKWKIMYEHEPDDRIHLKVTENLTIGKQEIGQAHKTNKSFWIWNKPNPVV